MPASSEGKTISSNIQEIAEANCRLTVSEISGRLRTVLEFMPAITCIYRETSMARRRPSGLFAKVVEAIIRHSFMM